MADNAAAPSLPDQTAADFVSWFKSQPGTWLHADIAIQPVLGCG